MPTVNMRHILKKIIRALAYLAAALVILLAVCVGLFRLLLPRLPEFQEEIKAWADATIGMQVEFTEMNARWRLSGPELTFFSAELTAHDTESSLLTADEVGVGVSLLRLLRDRELVVDRIVIRNSNLTLRLSEHEGWLIQGLPIADIVSSSDSAVGQARNDVDIVARNIVIDYLVPDSDEELSFVVDKIEVSRDDTKLVIDAVVDLPDSLGQRLDISAAQYGTDSTEGIWQFFMEGKGLSAPGWSELDFLRLPQFPQLRSGSLDMSSSVRLSAAGIDHATADFVLSDLAVLTSDDLAPFGMQGRIEYSKDTNAWLVSTSNFVVTTVDGAWPRSNLRIDVTTSDENKIDALSVSASYLRLDDARYIAPWLPEELQATLDEYDPSGVVQVLEVGLNALQSEQSEYSVSAKLLGAGVAAAASRPGFRKMSGLIRMDNAGGRLEIDSPGLIVDLASQFAEPMDFDDAAGTFIWRNNVQGTIILSDSILIRNADLESQSSLQVSLPVTGESPFVDFQGDWSVNDIAVVKRYLPAKLMKPNLYKWLSEALVAGSAPRGTAQLTGPLDKFPFDNGEGIFRIESQLEDTTLRYSDQWPDVQNMSLEVVVDGMRLYSHRNASNNAGNSVVNAQIEIPDLRKPILSIDAFATGSLKSILEFSENSPIARVFGGHLEDVNVEGDASFSLNLSYPISDRKNYAFSTRIQPSDGTLSVNGFEPKLTELNGIVNVSRDGVSSESLFGRFLGEQVDIELKPAGDTMPSYTVIAEATGRLSDAGLVEGLAPALETIIEGSSNYRARVYFPKGDIEQPPPFRIDVDTDLAGLAIDLPVPLGKPQDSSTPSTISLGFPAAGHIDATGDSSDNLKWLLSFVKTEDAGWDFDRGELAIGGDYPEQPEIRGLRIVGNTNSVALDDWLALADRGGDKEGESSGVADRIRSIDLYIGNFAVIGQNFKNHRFELQRSAEEWLVKASGEQVRGFVTVPYDFESGRPLVVDMETLILPGANEAPAVEAADDSLTDPRNIPPLSVSVKNFALGKRFFGELNAEFAITERGLESVSLLTRDSSFSVEGGAAWVVDASDESGQRTYLNGKLLSTDVEATLARLDYEPGIQGNQLAMDIDVSWSGGPREDFMATLDGNVALNLGSGQLNDVEPGAGGRVFGLMSVVALPRRLSLDFSDVFDKGFAFDKIVGTFRIDMGEAYTCDLLLEGPAADVGIVGRAGLATRDYDQTAVVSANFGNTLPVVGGLVAGPQVAAALWLFSRMFKKPLREVSQIYYGIDGSWDAPDIEATNAERFALNGGSAGCLDDAQ